MIMFPFAGTRGEWIHDSSFPTLLGFFPLPIAALAEERSCVFTAAGTYRNCTCFANRAWESLNNSSAVEQWSFCPIRAVWRTGNTYSIPLFSKLSPEPKILTVHTCRFIQCFPDLIALLCRFCFTSLPRCCPGRAITGRRGRTSRQPGQQKLRQLPKELPQPYFRVKDHRSPYLQTPVWFTSFKQFS